MICMNTLVIVLYTILIVCQTLFGSEGKQPFIAAYIMSVSNNTSKDYRISAMVHDTANIKKLRRKPLYVVHPYRAEIFEKKLDSKEIAFLDVSFEVDPYQRNAYLFVENLYDEDESFYLHLNRRYKDNRAIFFGAIKKKITSESLRHPILESFEFPFDSNKGSTTFLNLIFNDLALLDMEINFNSISGAQQP